MTRFADAVARALAVTLPLITAGAQVSWQSRATAPGPQVLHAMAYDDVRQRLVLLTAPRSAANRVSTTWEYDGSNWFRMTPTTAPLARAGAAMTFDSVRRRVVLFGGASVAGWVADTVSNATEARLGSR